MSAVLIDPKTVFQRDSDQANWERYLSTYGTVFNGSADDAPGIQEAVNALLFDGKKHRVWMPAGGLTTKFVSQGILLTAGQLGLDFNGLNIDASGMSGNGTGVGGGTGSTALIENYALSFQGSNLEPYGLYNSPLAIEGFSLLGPSNSAPNLSNLTDGIFIGRNQSNDNVNNFTLRNFAVLGFRDNFFFGNFAYFLQFYNFIVRAAWRYGLNVDCNGASGENLSWVGGIISDNNSISGTGASGSAVGVYLPNHYTANNGLVTLGFRNVSFDNNDIVFDILTGQVDCHACTIVDSHYDNVLGNISWASGGYPCGLRWIGGDIDIGGSGTRATCFTVGASSNSKNSYLEIRSQLGLYGTGTTLVTVTGTPQISVEGSNYNYGGTAIANYPSLGPYLNALSNGGFEGSGSGSTAGWTVAGTGYSLATSTSLVQNTACFPTSTYAGSLTSASGNSGSLTQTVRCSPGRAVSCLINWAIPTFTSGTSVAAQLIFLDSTGAAVQGGTITLGTLTGVRSTYVNSITEQCAPPGTVSVEFGLFCTNFTGTAVADSVELNVL